ncbi:MAG TPA: hypothetical protein VMX97_08035 [Hyphomicrobiaceae bacterium]|nr:hypothetical protein [Hyphomicrobiaceae bacterium]
MHFGSRLFVGIVFAVIGLAFWANTAQLYLEFAHGSGLWSLSGPIDFFGSFRNYETQPWFLLLTHYSDLFVFFPVFGTIALVAFFAPAAVLVDMYWNTAHQGKRRIAYSKLRFSVGFIVIAGLSFAIGEYVLKGGERTLWQLKPQVLKSDKGAGCVARTSCQRVSYLDALANIRKASRERITLVDLKRSCSRDWFVEPSRSQETSRYCPVTTNIIGNGSGLDGLWTSDKTCCDAQKLFDAAVKSSSSKAGNRSDTDALQQALWPANVFFLLTLLAISALLAMRRQHIEMVYPELSRGIDRGVMIGALAMILLPLMHNGFLLTADLLHGVGGTTSLHRLPETFTIVFGLWGVLIIVSFLHPANKQAEPISRILGVLASIAFALKGDVITDYVIRLFGAGAGFYSLVGMFITAASLVIVLWVWKKAAAKAADQYGGHDHAGNDGARLQDGRPGVPHPPRPNAARRSDA